MQPVRAALTGAREIAVPVISMTITLAAVYAPIGFVSGLTGALFREFAFTLAGAVVVSGIIALTLSPMMASKLLEAAHIERRLRPVPRSRVRQRCGGATSAGSPHAQPPARHPAGPGRRDGRRRRHVRHHAEGAGAGGGPGHPVQHGQDAADRQPRLSRAGHRRARQGVRHRAGEGARVRHQRLRSDVHQAFAGILFKPWEERERTQKQILQEPAAASWPASPARRSSRSRCRRCRARRRRPAGAVRDHDHGRLPAAGAGAGEDAGRGAARAASSSSPTRDLQVRHAADRDEDRPRQGQPPRHHACRTSAARWRRCSAATTSTASISTAAATR